MAEISKRGETLIERIEKLIVDGQKEVLGRLDRLGGRMDGLDGRMDRLDGRMDGLEGGLRKLDKKVDVVHSSLKNEIQIAGLALKDDIRELDEKLDAHMKLPAHA